ncbi:hypothetical protein QBC47DRAFT_426561 [Echria macrotheca]|uniref:Methyltransferase type 11 domain-containing protein n=1 Tax=Echria macrotheca TaxID=438768 RepID=A0AAJ0F608_9PEZI|nr:hypothetical protein QBC47DRAFT_426561 [Echria macrotheca]
MSIYRSDVIPPEDHIRSIRLSPNRPTTPAKPSFGLDSPAGLAASSITAPLYLYASLRGKFQIWDDILSQLSDTDFSSPSLDVGCGRGLVLLKIAQRKKAIAARVGAANVQPAYGIDIFASADQTGNHPVATYKNAAAMGVLDLTVLHSASFAETFPFADGVFSIVTASLSLHNVREADQGVAVREMARVCSPCGIILVVDLFGVNGHAHILKELGWQDVSVKGAGLRMVYGIFPCQILRAVKPG